MHAHLPHRSASRSSYGVTLLDLATALVLVALGLALVVPPAGSLRDRLAVGAVRNAVASLLVRARTEAPARGGARVEIRVPEDEVRLWAGDSLLAVHHPARDHGVVVELGGGRERADIVYDVLGLGRVASRTLVFVRGSVRDTLTVSSYGRVAR